MKMKMKMKNNARMESRQDIIHIVLWLGYPIHLIAGILVRVLWLKGGEHEGSAFPCASSHFGCGGNGMGNGLERGMRECKRIQRGAGRGISLRHRFRILLFNGAHLTVCILGKTVSIYLSPFLVLCLLEVFF